ncbi:MAG: hypothetical protein JST30_13805 [Armatimonadetes bacterium]|nr:hypothetical protein [Armatimonadota bacterium]
MPDMVAVFAAVLSWESSSAQALLQTAHAKVARCADYEAEVKYNLNKARMSASPNPGSTDSRSFVVKRSGDAYSVTVEGQKTWTGSRNSAATDPFLAVDHEFTRWFGFRKKRLTLSLLPPDAQGPVYTLLRAPALPKGCVAVIETYRSKGLPDFRFTTVIEERTAEIKGYCSFGAVTDVAESGQGEADRQGVIWSETVEITRRKS